MYVHKVTNQMLGHEHYHKDVEDLKFLQPELLFRKQNRYACEITPHKIYE